MIQPLSLARLPTPIEPLTRASARLGVDIWVKRDDLTGSGLSGNKVRKLDFLLADAVARGARTVITTGGVQSNHARATAVAARRLGMRPVLLLRGAPPAAPPGNLLLDTLLGAEIHWCTPAEYRDRDAIMARIAEGCDAPYIVPEGGSNALGALGYLRAGRELQAQQLGLGLEFDTVICAVGSGGTLAGLAAARLDAAVWGVAVCDDRATFRARVAAIGEGMGEVGGPTIPAPGAGWDVVEGFAGLGDGLARPEELREAASVARDEGLFLDPVYTGKAWFALAETARRDRAALGRRVLFWHTGGLFGMFGREAELAAALEEGA